jgi:hypothetical protein
MLKTMKRRSSRFFPCLLSLAVWVPASGGSAQTLSDANWISMNPGIPGANGSVSAAVVDASGNLYAAGGFSLVGDTLAHNVAKWDGSHWSALGSGLNQVNVLAVSGTNVYAGGAPTLPNGTGAVGPKWEPRAAM